jgi:hypothetical protein
MKDRIVIANPCLNPVFQYAFESKRTVIGFVNAVFNLEGKEAITEVEPLQKELPTEDPLSKFQYNFTVDYLCKSKQGDYILIKMQNDFRDDYHLKALIEHARMISRIDLNQTLEEQALRMEQNESDKNKFWKGIRGVYTIVITNKVFASTHMKDLFPNESVMEPLFVNSYERRHTEFPDRHYGDVNDKITVLMLHHLKDKPYEEMTLIEKWAYAFKDNDLRQGTRKINEIKEIKDPEHLSEGQPALKEFLERLEAQKLPERVVDRYHRFVQDFNLSWADIAERMKEWVKPEVREEVREEVKEEVREEVKEEVREEVKEEVREAVKEEIREKEKESLLEK